MKGRLTRKEDTRNKQRRKNINEIGRRGERRRRNESRKRANKRKDRK